MAGLADLYAVGVVGAIATNLGATSTDRKLSDQDVERTLMFGTFLVMAAIEISLLIDKPNARYFAVTILAVGLILRGLVQERRIKKEGAAQLAPERSPIELAAPIRQSRRRNPSSPANQFSARFAAPGGHSTSHCAKRKKRALAFICSSSANSRS